MLKIRNFKFNEIKNISIIKFVRLNLLKGAIFREPDLCFPSEVPYWIYRLPEN